MSRIINKNPNASTLNNGVEFKQRGPYMVSVGDVPPEMLEIFLAVPGFELLEDHPVMPLAASSPAALGVGADETDVVIQRDGDQAGAAYVPPADHESKEAAADAAGADTPAAGDAAPAGADQGAGDTATPPAAEAPQEAAKPAAKAAKAKAKAAE